MGKLKDDIIIVVQTSLFDKCIGKRWTTEVSEVERDQCEPAGVMRYLTLRRSLTRPGQASYLKEIKDINVGREKAVI